MAKKCGKCGAELPEGAASCPACGAKVPESRGAALFTQMTAETEHWRSRQKKELTKEQKRLRRLIVAAALAVALAVFLIFFLQPEARVLRAIRMGRYEDAARIYWSDAGLTERGSERIDQAVLETAERLTTQYAAHELDGDAAARDISALSTIGRGGERLSDVVTAFRTLNNSQMHMIEAGQLVLTGNYLEAREEYLLVDESDGDYAEAQQRAKQCLADYGDSVLSEADRLIQTGEYADALRTVIAGEERLLELEYYYEKLDLKHRSCAALLGEDLLKRALALAEEEDYQGAADLLQAHIYEFALSDENLISACDQYYLRARSHDVTAAEAEAKVLFAEGDYAGGFALLDALADDPEIPADELEAAVARLEQLFAQDKLAEAEELFGGVRENLPGAITVLREAMRLREVDEIGAYWDELSLYLPYSLASEDYIEKVGVIFRSTSTFEALDGTDYDEGWIWGDNQSELSFRLGGNYDRLNAVFTVRRDDDHQAAAYFEVSCDGTTVYHSERLEHWQTAPLEIEIPVTGCEVLTLRFVNDYNVSTTEDGYCYHGLCTPVVTKDLPEA